MVNNNAPCLEERFERMQSSARRLTKLRLKAKNQRRGRAFKCSRAVMQDHNVAFVGKLKSKLTLLDMAGRYATMVCSSCSARAKHYLKPGEQALYYELCDCIAGRDRNAARNVWPKGWRLYMGLGSALHMQQVEDGKSKTPADNDLPFYYWNTGSRAR